MKNKFRLILIITSTFIIGATFGYYLTNSYLGKAADYKIIDREAGIQNLPDHLFPVLNRFSLINDLTNKTLQNFIIIGGIEGSYEENGKIFETYVISFEDRYEGAEADNDFLDVIIEFKRAKGQDTVTVRMVQLGLDTIHVYLDNEFIGDIRPSIEIQVK